MRVGDTIVGTATHNRGLRMIVTDVVHHRVWARTLDATRAHEIQPAFYAVEHPQVDLFGPERGT